MHSNSKEMTSYGRLGYNHDGNCREMTKCFMKEDPGYRDLIQRHQRGSGSVDITDVTQDVGDIDVISAKRHELLFGNIKTATHCIQNKRRQESMVKIEAQLEQTVAKMIIANVQMANVYSCPRVTRVAREIGIRVGWSFDLAIHDADGKDWDFNGIDQQ